MSSPLAGNLLRPLGLSQPTNPTPTSLRNSKLASEANKKEYLQSLLLLISNHKISDVIVTDTVGALIRLQRTDDNAHLSDTTDTDAEEDALERAIVSRLIIGLYAEGLDMCISQATDAETEAEWWADIGRSRTNVTWYLLQTLPSRLAGLARVIIQTLRSQNLPIRLSNLTPTSLRQLFPSQDSFRPNVLTKALFPHLRRQSFSDTPSTLLFSPYISIKGIRGGLRQQFTSGLGSLTSLIKLPLELTRQECAVKRRELEQIRDTRAEALGQLAQLRGSLALVVKDQPWNIQHFLHVLTCIIKGDTSVTYLPASTPSNEGVSTKTLSELHDLSIVVFASQKASHQQLFASGDLRRPSRLTLLWPKLLLLPPICIYALRSAYTSRASLAEIAKDTKDTVEGFIRGWLIEPLKDVLKIVRTGGEDGMIVRKEGVAADFDSLERMALSLAKDELHYGPEQLAILSKQIKLGDLTPVLQLYEEDIKHPLKSAITGTFLRSVFIQVQKAKVDIDQTLAGIDKLLQSQELTFAFVGVAPAFAIVYLLGGSLATLWSGGRGKGKYGGRRRIGGVWSAMRRTERLLVSQPDSPHRDTAPISPLTAGLLLISVTQLRTYAETCLPARSRLREGFLEDVGDLENPDLGRAEKMRVVERMWRCWGDILGWRKAGEGVILR